MNPSLQATPQRILGAAILGFLCLLLAAWILWSARSDEDHGDVGQAAIGSLEADSLDLRDTRLRNAFAYLVPQCYVMPRLQDGVVLNPCYTCHQLGDTPNYIDDSLFQKVFQMAESAREMPWPNVYEDRSERIERIDDIWMRDLVRTSNYEAKDGSLLLARRLSELPAHWDLDGDRHWNGYIPDAYFRFDEQGFDRDPQGQYTGWRAFAYYPLPATYWPTNGSAGDVLIRLPDAFRRRADGEPDVRVYALNLAIVEALIKRADVPIDPVDERDFGVDLDRDGSLDLADRVRYDWAPLEGREMSYVGLAAQRLAEGKAHLAGGLFPEGTEFLQSLRYLDADAAGRIQPAARMKELRYARKQAWYNYSELRGIAQREGAERREYENNVVKEAPGDYERGLFAQGWVYQGFIEDRAGQLRPQSQEETLYCMGCHGGVGVTADTTFAFARKFKASAEHGGWFHWSRRDASDLAEPWVEVLGEGVHPEYGFYLKQTRSGSEFLDNPELADRFFTSEGIPREEAFERLRHDIAFALLPSPERAMRLNKAYRTIVEDQDFIHGRDPNPTPFNRVMPVVPKDLPTGVEQAIKTATHYD
ncbi:hypothetical protein [Thiocystis violascens]|uniref:Uncharacterized protein n=1 Tax=Thiocystis violascens (strain ATCC 17096 / DSM 198 / 6111) TaxID=765911 RepID=I3Y6F1_THIV6|nr:hypothetical protein [Thiocystis violascens]AFL72569.1 hypothetical protein Thivi_0508 [Thiocystis violascens DSM 198]